jgi:hypothetical protein
MTTRIGAIAGEISRHYRENAANSGVYEIEWETFPDGSHPVGWRFVGDAADARNRGLLGQAGYVQVSTSRGDIISQTIAGR